MRKYTRTYKGFVAALFASIYLFAVVFSGFLHTHTNNFNESLVSVKSEPVSSKIVNFGGVDDCFSSHFYNAGLGILNSETNFQIVFSEIFNPQNFSFLYSVTKEEIVFFSLRGPPVLI